MCTCTVTSCDLWTANESINQLIKVIFKHTYCWQPRPDHSHTVCSRPCHWTDPSAEATGKRTESRHLFIHTAHTHTHTQYIYTVYTEVNVFRLRLTAVFGSAPDTDRSRVRRRGVCRSNFLCSTHRSFLQAEFPAGYRYKLPKHTTKQWSNRFNYVSLSDCSISTLCMF